MKPKSLLLIGGTGFFGHSILKFFSNSKNLKKEFRKIIIISRNKLQKYDYHKQLKKNYKVIKINSDIRNLKKIPNADYVIYAAILNNFKQDYLAVKNYTRLAKKYHKNSKILFTSSGAIYGKQPNNINGFKENYLPNNIKINYEKSYKNKYAYYKMKNEEIFHQLGSFGIKTSIARCFSFVGEFIPRNSKYVIGNFIDNILKNEKISIKSSYVINRSYMYSDDLVKCLLKIVENATIDCPTYNVGSSDIVSLHKVAKFLAKKYNLELSFPKILFKQYDNYIPNTDLLKKKLNFKTNFTSTEAILKTVNLLKK
jgi:nucleoside-diphosphate-sugar epimerase